MSGTGVVDGIGWIYLTESSQSSPVCGTYNEGGLVIDWCVGGASSERPPGAFDPIHLGDVLTDVWTQDLAERLIRLGPPWTTGFQWDVTVVFRLSEHSTAPAHYTSQSVFYDVASETIFKSAVSSFEQPNQAGFGFVLDTRPSYNPEDGYSPRYGAELMWDSTGSLLDELGAILPRALRLHTPDGPVTVEMPFGMLNGTIFYVLQLEVDQLSGQADLYFFELGSDRGSPAVSHSGTPTGECQRPSRLFDVFASVTGAGGVWNVEIDEITMCGSSAPERPVFGYYEESMCLEPIIELSGSYEPGSVEIWADGIRQAADSDFLELDPAAGLVSNIQMHGSALRIRYYLVASMIGRQISLT